MSEAQTTLSDLSALICAFRDARGWRNFHAPRNLAMAISVEANELLECFLWSSDGQTFSVDMIRNEIAPEIADVMIYALSLVDALGLDAEQIIRDKVSENAKKYPADRDYTSWNRS